MRTSTCFSAIKAFMIGMLLLLVLCLEVSAREVGGVDVPESVTIGNKLLVLNGAGIRKKFFIKVYVGALYLPVKRSTASGILADPGAKRISIHSLFEMSDKKLVKTWNDGFSKNNSATELKALQERINQFNSLFPTVKEGDEIRIDYLPGEGTQVWINGTVRGIVSGEDFSRAVLKIWLGDKPADEGLKNAWLGK